MSDTRTAKEPTDVDRLFEDRLNAGDLDGLVALYEPGGTLVRGDGSPATGPPAIRAELEPLLAAKPRGTLNVVHVVPGGDLALLYNEWKMTLTGPDGRPAEIAGRAVEVVRRQPDGTWRFVVDDPYGGSPR